LEVRVQIERSPEPLHDDHRTPPRVGESRITRPATQEAEDGPQRHAADGATQIMVPGEEIAQPVRQREHPLPHRDIGEDVVDEMGGPFGHAPSTAARAHRPPLAREGDQTVGATGATSKPSEPAREPAASQKAPELLLDEAGQPFSIAQAGRLGAKGLEVLPALASDRFPESNRHGGHDEDGIRERSRDSIEPSRAHDFAGVGDQLHGTPA